MYGSIIYEMSGKKIYSLLKRARLNILFFFLIVAVASVFRLTNLDLMEFKIDEASNLFLASRLINDQSILPAGTATSIGILNPPFFIYFLIPITFVSQDPKFAAFIIALINCLSIGFLYLVINKYYGQKLAVITSLLIALSPWSILFSRKIWPPDLVLPFAVVIFYSLHKTILEKNTKCWIVLIASLVLLFQLDLIYVFFSFLLTLNFNKLHSNFIKHTIN